MIEHRRPTEEDLDAVARMERNDGFDLPTEELRSTLDFGIGKSVTSRTYVIDGDAVCVMGIMSDSLLATEAHAWMIALPALERHKVAFARAVPGVIGELPYGSLTCFCDPAFTRTVRWLSRLGFVKVGGAVIRGRPFDMLERKL